MITLSESATKEIVRLKSRQQPDILVRLEIVAGGCSDWIYDLHFDRDVKPTDQVFTCGLMEIPLVIDAKSLDKVCGLTVDYSEDLMGGAFRFDNPKAIATCSCGNSFAVG